MRLLPGSPVLFTLILIFAALHTSASAALNWQVGRGSWTGGLGLRYLQANTTAESDRGTSDSSSQTLSENFYLNGSRLYVLDPRLVTINLGLSLSLNQFDLSSTFANDRVAESGNSNKWLGYKFEADFLKEKPYTARFYANRQQIETQQSFGARSTGVTDNLGLQLVLTDKSVLTDWGFRWFSASLGLAQSKRSSTTSFLDFSSQDESSQRTLNFAASKGFINADLAFNYSLAESETALQRQSNPRSQTATLNYSVDFGPGLNRQFNSGVVYRTTSGGLPNNRLEADAKLHIDHYRNLSSEYTYEFNRLDRDDDGDATGFVSSEHIGTASLSHQLYQNLNSSVSLNVNQGSAPNGSRSSYGGAVAQGYSHGLPGGGRLGLSWSASYSHVTNALRSGSIDVIGEAHIAPPMAAPGFLLANSFVIRNSIVVFNLRDGLPGKLMTEDEEYRIVDEGDRVRIEPIYGAGAIAGSTTEPILPGDPLEVSYSYQVDADATYQTLDTGYGATVDYGWFGASYQHQQSEFEPLAGEVQFVRDTRTDTTSVWLNFRGVWLGVNTSANARHTHREAIESRGPRQEDTTRVGLQGSSRVRQMDLTGSANFERYRATLQDYDSRNLSANLSWRPMARSYNSYNWRLGLSANASDVYFPRTARQSGTRELRGGLDWRTPTGWQNRVFAALKTRSNDSRTSQTAAELGANTSKRYGKIIMNANVSLVQVQSGGTTINSQHFQINVLREFY